MTRGKSMISVEEALGVILAEARPLPAEMVPLFDAHGRILARDVIASVDIPSADNSAMDGYALVSSDTRGATRARPARLPVRGEIKAGLTTGIPGLTTGSAIRIMTGAPVPLGADSVVQFEDTAEEGGSVLVLREVQMGENIRRAGEDVSRGAVALWARPKRACSPRSIIPLSPFLAGPRWPYSPRAMKSSISARN